MLLITIPSQHDVNELVAAKIVKEANRVIKAFPEEKITIENERWGKSEAQRSIVGTLTHNNPCGIPTMA